MASRRTRVEPLQEWRDAQEQQGLAEEEIAPKKARMERYEEIKKQRAILQELEIQVATFTRELSYLEAEERRLTEPLPIGSEREGGAAVQQDRDRQLLAIRNRRTELLNSRHTALEAQEVAQNAMDAAQGEFWILGGSIMIPEEELAESQETQARIQNQLAPPPAPEARSPDSGDRSDGHFLNGS